MAEKKDIAYRIYQAKTKVSVFDLLYEYGIAYTALKPVLDEFVGNKVLATEDGRYYEFIGDGRMFSGKHKRKQLQDFDNEKEKVLQERRAYLEARRLELIKRMQADLDEDDEEDVTGHNDDEEADLDLFELRMAQKIMLGSSSFEGEDEDEDKDNDSKPDDDLCKLVLKNIIETIAVNKRDDHYYIEINGVDLCKTDAKFELFPCNEKVYVCDQGATLCSLEETIEVDDELRKRMANIAAESGAVFIDEKLCVEVGSAEQTLACLFRLYAAMERVYHFKDSPLKEETEEGEAIPEVYVKALEYIVKSGKVSMKDLHRELGFGLNTIRSMFEWMEKEGFITPFRNPEKNRKVLLTMEEFKRRFGKK